MEKSSFFNFSTLHCLHSLLCMTNQCDLGTNGWIHSVCLHQSYSFTHILKYFFTQFAHLYQSHSFLIIFQIEIDIEPTDKVSESKHDKTNHMTCTQRRFRSHWASTQPLLCTLSVSKDPDLLPANRED